MGKPPKTPSRLVLKAYAPVLPAHLAHAPSFVPPRPPPLLPFFRDKAHTIPTKWGLYRPLLQATYSRPPAAQAGEEGGARAEPPAGEKEARGYPYLRREIRRAWKKRRADIIIKRTAVFLESQFQLLASLRSTHPDTLQYLAAKEQSLAQKYQRLEAARIDAARVPKPKYRLTGAYIWPSHTNPPLPRLKPQPPHISGMIRNRVMGKHKRVVRFQQFQEWERDMRFEHEFLGELGVDPRPARMEQAEEFYRYFNQDLDKDWARARMVFTAETCAKVEQARKAKFRGIQQMWARRRRRAERERQAGEQAQRASASSASPASGGADTT